MPQRILIPYVIRGNPRNYFSGMQNSKELKIITIVFLIALKDVLMTFYSASKGRSYSCYRSYNGI